MLCSVDNFLRSLLSIVTLDYLHLPPCSLFTIVQLTGLRTVGMLALNWLRSFFCARQVTDDFLRSGRGADAFSCPG